MIPHDEQANSKCQRCPVRYSGPCRYANAQTLALLASASTTASYPPGATIIIQGDPITHVCIVRSGVVKLVNTTSDARQMIVGMIEPGGMIGNVIDANSRFAYEAASAVTLCMIPRPAFIRIAREQPDIAYRALELTQGQAEEVQEWLTLFGGRTALQRLAGYLHALAHRQRSSWRGNQPITLLIPVPRGDIAAYLGTTRETLSRGLQQLARMRILEVPDRKRVVITNIHRLGQVAGDSGEELHMLSSGHRSLAASSLTSPTRTDFHAA